MGLEPQGVPFPGAKPALKRRALIRHAPRGRYTYTLNLTTHMDLTRGAYSSAHELVSACLVPSDTIVPKSDLRYMLL